MKRVFVDSDGGIYCPHCGGKNCFVRVGILPPRRLRCMGCGNYLKFGRG